MALAILPIARNLGQVQFNAWRRGERWLRRFWFLQEDGLSLCLLFEIALTLEQESLIPLQFLQELCQQGTIDGDSFLVVLTLLFSPLI